MESAGTLAFGYLVLIAQCIVSVAHKAVRVMILAFK